MQDIGIWDVTEQGPRKLLPSSIDLEEHLESWIERDPALLDAGLVIVGRQMSLEGGPLDLLAIDPQGRWVVIEIKRGIVRRETVAQALDYASCIATIPYEQLSHKVDAYLASKPGLQPATLESILEARVGPAAWDTARDVLMFVVGTGRDPGLERMVQYLTGTFEVPIRVVTFTVFEFEPGRPVLVRELTDTETQPPTAPKQPAISVEQLCRQADAAGVGGPFRAVLQVATGLGLYPRAYKHSVMYAPASNKTRCLFTIRSQPDATGQIWMYIAAEAFAQFYARGQEHVVEELGGNGWVKFTPAVSSQFIAGLQRLFEHTGESE